jgi:bifunctional DNA-binding transcriptional regulator/antitoxin component of YhaV-PrlF toxin-antitoxin module
VGSATVDGIPQIVTIVTVSAEGRLNLKKAARQHLGLEDAQTLFLDTGDEIILSAEGGKGSECPLEKGGRITLPEDALSKLGIAGRSLVGLVQRERALAVKQVEVVEGEGERPRLLDVETAYRITRRAESNPMPEKLLPKLTERYGDLKLRYDAGEFLKGRQTLEAWKARKLLGTTEPSDEQLKETLIGERLGRQREDGSWEGQVAVTARNLRELADLGMTREDRELERSVEWLMARPESAHNPGMFFATDQLVEEQATVAEEKRKAIEEGRRGPKPRFRKLRAPEKRLVMAGDDLIGAPCGPRIMWPNALALEALLALGYEGHLRVQRALRTLLAHEWCECGYQHGRSDWRRAEPLTMDEIAAIEATCVSQYRFGGRRTEELKTADMAHSPFHMPRIAHTAAGDADEYLLRMDAHLQGCEVITTRAMSQVGDARMKRFAEAHLWRFAGQQQSLDGRFPEERGGYGLLQAGLLDLFARYDHPASKAAIMRAIPWILGSQNEDGSWGEEPRKDASTLAILSALVSVGDHLPSDLKP